MYVVGTRATGQMLTLYSGVIHYERKLAFVELDDAHDDNPHMHYEVFSLDETNGPIGDPE